VTEPHEFAQTEHGMGKWRRFAPTVRAILEISRLYQPFAFFWLDAYTFT
jgi:hypothetical protein